MTPTLDRASNFTKATPNLPVRITCLQFSFPVGISSRERWLLERLRPLGGEGVRGLRQNFLEIDFLVVSDSYQKLFTKYFCCCS